MKVQKQVASDFWLPRAKLLIKAAVTGLVLLAALFIVLSDTYSEATSKWAAGLVGVVVGYWLR